MRIYVGYLVFHTFMGLLDSVTIYRAAAIMGSNPLELGLMSSLWSLAYIAGAYVFGAAGDRGSFGGLKAASAILTASSLALTYFSQDFPLLLLGYVLHALALSSGRITISVSILENVEAEGWDDVNRVLRGLYWILRGISVYCTVWAGLHAPLVALAIASPALLVLMPGPLLRRLFLRLSSRISQIYRASSASQLILTLDLERGAGDLLSRAWGFSRTRSPAAIAASASMMTLSAEMVLTPAPSELLSFIGGRGIAAYMALSAVLTGLWILGSHALPRGSGSIAGAAMVFSSALALAYISQGAREALHVILLLSVFSAFYQIAELESYNKYNEATSGYGGGLYLAVREAGGLLGGLASGLASGLAGYWASLAIGIGILLISIVIRAL